GCVEDLNLHALIRCIAGEWRPDSNAVVATGLRAKLEAKDEVCEFFHGEEIATTVFGADQIAVLDRVAWTFLFDESPAAQRFAIKQRNKRCVGSRQRPSAEE